MKITTVEEFKKESTRVMNTPAHDPSSILYYSEALKFIRKKYGKDTHSDCYAHLYPGVCVGRTKEQQQIAHMEDIQWLTQYVDEKERDPEKPKSWFRKIFSKS